MVSKGIQMLLALTFVSFVIYYISQSNLNANRKPRTAEDRNASISSQDQTVTNRASEENRTTVAPCVIPEYDHKGVAMDDPHLVDYIRRELLHPPSPLHYSLKDPKKADFSQFGQSEYAANILHGMRGGFFVEAGALDGEFISNTLRLEMDLGWRGLLVEPDPETYKKLRQKHRNVFTINVALSTTQNATDLILEVKDEIFGHAHLSKEGVRVKGIPLYSILLALEVKVVDFFSLDVESFEVKVLETIPWEKVHFRLMCIEINHIPEGLDHLVKYLTDKGYKFLGVRQIDAWFGWPKLLEQTKV